MGESENNADSSSMTRRRLLIAGAFTAVGGAAIARMPVHSSKASPKSRPAGTAKATVKDISQVSIQDAAPQPGDDHTYEIIIANGRVIDPDTGIDKVLNVGIDGGRITGLGPGVQKAAMQIDAKGKVVSPGFIDPLSYEPVLDGVWHKVADGVTTNLGMHGMQQGVWADQFFTQYSGQTPIHFGGAFSDHWVRYNKFGLNVGAAASPDQVTQLAETLDEELSKGWLGVCFEPEYTPGVTTEEIMAMARVAKRHNMPCYFHGRYSSYGEEAKTVPEIIKVAEETGAAVHIAHLHSTGGTWDMERALTLIDKANDAGHDVTACLYPYNFWATFLGSARFSPGWQQRFRIDYNDLQVAGTNDRLTSSSFTGAQSRNLLAVAYAIPERSLRLALQHPKVMIGSDAILDTGNNHPRASGTFARVLGKYVRDDNVLSLRDAIAKMTILPARRLEAASPAMARKGRIQRGADADICVFDAAKVADKATVAQPDKFSTGFSWVLVGGKIVLGPDGLRRDKLPGKPLKGNS